MSTEWSLVRRLSAWLAGACVVSVALLLVTQAWSLDLALGNELDAMIEEEGAEVRAELVTHGLDASKLEDMMKAIAAEHGEIVIQVGIRHAGAEAYWFLGSSDTTDVGRFESALGDDQRRRADELDVPTADGGSARIAALVFLDGAARRASLERELRPVFLLLCGAVVIAAAVGLAFVRRLAHLFDEVAKSAEQRGTDSEVVVPARAPREVQRIVEAFRVTLDGVQSAHSRNLILTAGLAHELRSPLQNLMSEVEVVLLRERSATEYRRTLARQNDELHALALVVDNLITLTALRDASILPRGTTFDLFEELRLQVGREEEEALRADVELAFEVSGPTVLHGDREALVLMIRNLLDNAVRWSPPGEVVRLELHGSADELVVRVEDAGPGVPTAQREAVFEAFYTGGAPKGSRAGYGLGLALARTVARAAGGDIRIEDRAGGGARFVVRLPRIERRG